MRLPTEWLYINGDERYIFDQTIFHVSWDGQSLTGHELYADSDIYRNATRAFSVYVDADYMPGDAGYMPRGGVE